MKKVLILSGSPRKGGIYGTGVYQPGEVQTSPGYEGSLRDGQKRLRYGESETVPGLRDFTLICSGIPSSASCCPIQTSVWQLLPPKQDTHSPARPLRFTHRFMTDGVMRFGNR